MCFDIVNQRPHFGHIIGNRTDDGADILFGRNAMIRQINNVLCYSSIDLPVVDLVHSSQTSENVYRCNLFVTYYDL